VSADSLFPIVVWTVIHCKVSTIHILISHLERFLPRDQKQFGEVGMCLSLIEAAVFHVCQTPTQQYFSSDHDQDSKHPFKHSAQQDAKESTREDTKDSKEDIKKEDIKKEDIKKEDIKKEDSKKDSKDRKEDNKEEDNKDVDKENGESKRFGGSESGVESRVSE